MKPQSGFVNWRWAWFLPAIAEMIAISCLSSFSVLPALPSVLSFDKLQHALAYFVLASLMWLGFARGANVRSASRTAVFSWGGTVCFGALDEMHQRFVPGRQADVLDLLADAVGAGFACFCIRYVSGLRSKEGRESAWRMRTKDSKWWTREE